MIDIHSHILPGLDDGARTPDEALRMIQMAARAGTADIIATPHANEQFRFDEAAAECEVAALRQASSGTIRIHLGCELHLTPENVADALQFPRRYTLARGSYLLIEFSNFQIPKSTGEILSRLMHAGTRPILAHPERNPILAARPEMLAELVAHGSLVQVTASSLTGRFGHTAETCASELIRRGMVHFLASDAHDTQHRPPLLDEARELLEHHYGSEFANRLLVQNPRAVIEGDPVELKVFPARRKFHFAFW